MGNQTVEYVLDELAASNHGWRLYLMDSYRREVQWFIQQIGQRLQLLTQGDLSYIESTVVQETDHGVNVGIWAFSPTLYVKLAGSVSSTGDPDIGLATAVSRASITHVNIRSLVNDNAGEVIRAEYDLGFGTGQVVSLGSHHVNRSRDDQAVALLRSSLDLLAQRS